MQVLEATPSHVPESWEGLGLTAGRGWADLNFALRL